jgi:phosphoribosylamine--glycine ligase
MFGEGRQVALKASGNALGKGVIVCSSLEEAIEGINVLKALGEAGRTLVIEERLVGREFSLLTVVSDQGIVSLPVAQDHKRVNDNDEGPNTGGMGTFSPIDWLDSSIVTQVEEEVVKPIIRTLHDDKLLYRGILFSGLMVTPEGPKCIEYNVRFGDPETQSIVRRLGPGFANLLMQAALGNKISEVPILNQSSMTVALASAGYPGSFPKGLPITIGNLDHRIKLFHAGTAIKDGQLVTSGGRVLGVSAVGKSSLEARNLAYDAVKQISFDGIHYRTDIGA